MKAASDVLLFPMKSEKIALAPTSLLQATPSRRRSRSAASKRFASFAVQQLSEAFSLTEREVTKSLSACPAKRGLEEYIKTVRHYDLQKSWAF